MEVRLLGRLGLVVSHKSEGYEHGGIDCNGIVDQRADDLLDEADRFGGKAGRSVIGFGVLGVGTKDREVPGMRGILGAGRRKVLKFVQGFWNLGGHIYIVGAASVITGEGESAEEVGGPID